MKRISKIIVGGSAASAALLTGLAATASTSSPDPTDLDLVDVDVVSPNTIDAEFNNPLNPEVAMIPSQVFHVPHFNHETPHEHDVINVVLMDDGRTARITLARNLHPENRPCDGPEPRCSQDRLPFIVTQAMDVFGNTATNDDWEVRVGEAKN
jgi:hypothetical protein